MFRNNLLRKNTVGESGVASFLQKEKHRSAKFDVSKVLFPDIGKITNQKNGLSLKGISCLQLIFVLIWMKQTLIWFNLKRDGAGNRLSNTKDTLAESVQLLISVLHQRSASTRLVSQVHMMTRQNIKKKYLMCQIPVKMVKNI